MRPQAGRQASKEGHMAFETDDGQTDAGVETTPMQIAHHPTFTAKEKMDLLLQLKAEAVSIAEEGMPVAFQLSDIDAAIADVKRSAEEGENAFASMRGES
jgi:hypothetical protein